MSQKMMVNWQELKQDTVTRKIITNQDSTNKRTDSVSFVISSRLKDSGRNKSVSVNQNLQLDYTDTTSVCTRNSIADITYYDLNNFILRLRYTNTQQFPFNFVEEAKQHRLEEQAVLLRHLKPGKELPAQPFHSDWMIIIIMATAFLFSIVKSGSKRMSPYFERIFTFKGINDNSSRDVSGLFHWQSTILNLISFLIIGLFGYFVTSYFELIPVGFKGITIWLIAMGIISIAVTIRHFVCLLTGAVSGQQEVFREYLLGIYHSYRFGALFLFFFIIMMSYTDILPVRDFILSGIFIAGLIYLIRIIRLIFIFLNRNISIFYLILYLCALEFLPVLIVVKYFTGLV